MSTGYSFFVFLGDDSNMNMENVFSDKLKALREKLNLSYQDVADMVGLSKQSIFKFEKGETKPSSDTILKFSEVFNIPYQSFYVSGSEVNIAISNIQFRESHKIIDKDIFTDQIKQVTQGFLQHLFTIEKLLGDEKPFVNPLEGVTVSDGKDVEKAAKMLRKKWKLGFAPIADVVELLEEKGIIVFEVKINNDQDFTGLSGNYHSIPVIVLNERFTDIGRKRFTALHELAHLLLEFSEGLPDAKIEKFCDRFAGAVLLVDEVIFQKFGKNRTNITLNELKPIKELYGISILAIIVRVSVTRLISYETYQRWYEQYNEWNDTVSEENFGVYKSIEKPSRFYRLLVQGVIERKISPSKAAELAGKKVDTFKQEIESLNFNLN